MNIESCYKIGLIMKPHGLKGEVTVSLDHEAPEDFENLESVYVATGERLLPYFVESISRRGAKAFMKFEDIDSPEAAKAISKSSIFLPKSSRPKSGRGEFYDDEVIGFEVSDENLGAIGVISEVVQAGLNKLLSVKSNGKEILIPTNSPFIVGVNKSRKKITVSLPEGYLDL